MASSSEQIFSLGEDETAAQDRRQIKSREKTLGLMLRKLCDSKGVEKDCKQSAKVIHQLGLNYALLAPDKISLIRSAILLNAAIVRMPDNAADVRADLKSVCELVLQLADAKSKNADLIGQAMLSFKKVKDMRDTASRELKKVRSIPEHAFGERLRIKEAEKIDRMQKIQEKISEDYAGVMQEIMEYSIQVMGDAPCEYALVGMGSLVTKEITPYSDFESVIVLEDGVQFRNDYGEVLEYFRWAATIFLLVLVNFGETVIYDAAVPSLNSTEEKGDNWFYDAFTPCGISPDGFYPHASHNPLGRQANTSNESWGTELIKPVAEMLKYLDSREMLKRLDQEKEKEHGYGLANVLTKHCFVCGDRSVYRKFENGVQAQVERKGITDNFIRQLKKDQQSFNVSRALSNTLFNDAVDIKRVIYRTMTMSIAALGQMHQMEWSSSFEQVDKLAKYLPLDVRTKAKCAVAMACEVRLRTYLSANSQVDRLMVWEYKNAEYLSKLVELLGSRGACDFIIIVVRLQEIAIKSFEQKTLLRGAEPESEHTLRSLFQSFLTMQMSLSPEQHSVKTVADDATATFRMMSYEEEERKYLFPPDKLAEHYAERASVLMDLLQCRPALQFCQKSLSFKESVPMTVMIKVQLVVKYVCVLYFKDDQELNGLANIFSPTSVYEFIGIPLGDLATKNWERVVGALRSKFDEDHGPDTSFKTRTLLRYLVLSVLNKMKNAKPAALGSGTLTSWSNLCSILNMVSSFFKGSRQNSFNISWLSEIICDAGADVSQRKEANVQGEEVADETNTKLNPHNQQREDYLATQWVDMLNQYSKSVGNPTVTKNPEQYEKLKELRRPLVSLFKAIERLGIQQLTMHLRRLKQHDIDGKMENIATRYPTEAEFKNLASNFLSVQKDLAEKASISKAKQSSAAGQSEVRNMGLVEDQLD